MGDKFSCPFLVRSYLAAGEALPGISGRGPCYRLGIAQRLTERSYPQVMLARATVPDIILLCYNVRLGPLYTVSRRDGFAGR